jgi:hypothetical protein
VVTRTDIANHYENASKGFGGIYVDDVRVVGNTTTGGRAVDGGSWQSKDGSRDTSATEGQPADDCGQQGIAGGTDSSPADNGGAREDILPVVSYEAMDREVVMAATKPSGSGLIQGGDGI